MAEWQPEVVVLERAFVARNVQSAFRLGEARGAVLAAVADIVIRLLPPGPELKLGVVTALLGAPFFLQLIMRPRPGGAT
jgi:iron complex transport system permease protein